MSYIELKYINLISPKLQKFAKKKDNLYNFRCPYCGDSSRNRNKSRGYFYRVRNDYFFKCHNCGMGRTLGNFLKDQDAMLYDEYVMERYKEGITGKSTNTPNPTFDIPKPVFRKNIFSELPKISELNTTHPAREYLINRKIPEKYLSKLYFAEDYNAWAKTNRKGKESRIIIPLFSKDKNAFGFQARAIDPNSKLRYITTILDKQYPKLFGMDNVNYEDTIFVLEGPFDSMFIENSVAMCGSDVLLSKTDFKDRVFVFDNEPRNRQIVDKYLTAIDQGEKVVIWPKGLTQKDINDMIDKGNMSIEEVNNLIKKHTYSGLVAKVKFTEWKKV